LYIEFTYRTGPKRWHIMSALTFSNCLVSIPVFLVGFDKTEKDSNTEQDKINTEQKTKEGVFPVIIEQIPTENKEAAKPLNSMGIHTRENSLDQIDVEESTKVQNKPTTELVDVD